MGWYKDVNQQKNTHDQQYPPNSEILCTKCGKSQYILWKLRYFFTQLRWLKRLVSYEVRGTVGARVTWMLIATYFFNNHMYYSYIWVEGYEITEISPEKSDSKNLLFHLEAVFYILYFSRNFLLIEVVNPLFL